jgi:integrase
MTYDRMFKTHLAYLEKWPLSEITRNDLKHLLVKKLRGGHLKKTGKPMKANSVKGILVPLRKCLQAAVDDNLIPANPAARVRVPQRKDQTAEDKIERYTREEIAHILKVAREQMPHWYPAILTAARTGLRVGELCGLRVEDINFAERFVHVRRTISRRIEGTPKSGKSRKVDMSAQLAEVLQDHIRSREIAATVAGKDPTPWVFGSLETGRYRNDEELAKGVWPRLLVLAGARPLKFHSLRHTFASLLLEQGESPAYVKDQLGHASISITVDIYGHLIPGTNRGAVDKLDDPQEVYQDAISRNPRATGTPTTR